MLEDLESLPSSLELPDSDDTPVDNEIRNLIPNLLKAILGFIWGDRTDWFFGVDMGIYDRQGQRTRTPIIPDGFLSLGVERLTGERGRLSYVLAEENNIAPILVLELVSQTYGGEYDRKMQEYARLGVLYYVIYNSHHWQRDRHQPLEVYRLVNGVYELRSGSPVFMPEINLGIGVERGVYERWERDWLYWYDRARNRYETPEERVQRERLQAERERDKAEIAESLLQQERQQREVLEIRLQQYLDRFGNLPE
ncbi:Uma2 family endonuclease [Pannus brasiliensis CCIBt3594]|uniref:Uma2 family endonuclease n=1 Tax=Pannus brasiliensis CCIBt3594 TaxID=1427578 RepID=A0AAW9QFM5_9CHRO